MSEATNRAAVALALADAFVHLARTDDGNDPTPAAVLAFAETAGGPEWARAEALAGRTRPASEATRATVLAFLATRVTDVGADPFASFQKDRSR